MIANDASRQIPTVLRIKESLVTATPLFLVSSLVVSAPQGKEPSPALHEWLNQRTVKQTTSIPNF
jgi:hypothetical protein